MCIRWMPAYDETDIYNVITFFDNDCNCDYSYRTLTRRKKCLNLYMNGYKIWHIT